MQPARPGRFGFPVYGAVPYCRTTPFFCHMAKIAKAAGRRGRWLPVDGGWIGFFEAWTGDIRVTTTYGGFTVAKPSYPGQEEMSFTGTVPYMIMSAERASAVKEPVPEPDWPVVRCETFQELLALARDCRRKKQ